ncbi:MAG: hypothetical protein D6705_09480 [Deltaproteobacteria bacterium]|nr:MAG: hypothetical protein D6705_09480 [Deltaproteobacteria bacterium]
MSLVSACFVLYGCGSDANVDSRRTREAAGKVASVEQKAGAPVGTEARPSDEAVPRARGTAEERRDGSVGPGRRSDERTPKSERAEGDSVADRLRRTLGSAGAVVVLPGKDGVVAMSADGRRSATLAPGRPYAVLVDNRSGVVWYQTGRQLRAVDLMAPATSAEPMVVATAKDELFEGLSIRFEDPAETLGPREAVSYSLVVAADPHFESHGRRCGSGANECPKLT